MKDTQERREAYRRAKNIRDEESPSPERPAQKAGGNKTKPQNTQPKVGKHTKGKFTHSFLGVSYKNDALTRQMMIQIDIGTFGSGRFNTSTLAIQTRSWIASTRPNSRRSGTTLNWMNNLLKVLPYVTLNRMFR
jgi:hypothetical protein